MRKDAPSGQKRLPFGGTSLRRLCLGPSARGRLGHGSARCVTSAIGPHASNIARVMYSTRVFTLAAKPAIDLRGRKIDADSGPDRLHFSYMAWEGFSMRIHNQFAFADGMRLLRQAQRTNGVGYVIIGS